MPESPAARTFARPSFESAFAAPAFLRAMLAFEVALAESEAAEGAIPAGAAPFLDVSIFARGLLKALRTRVYLADEAAVRADPALASIARSPRIRTLVAAPSGDGSYRWDVRLQGEGETVFFAF